MLRSKADDAIASLPRATGGAEPRMNRELGTVLEDADTVRRDLHDDYLSVEHLALAMHKRVGIGTEEMLVALKEVRGSHRVTTPIRNHNSLHSKNMESISQHAHVPARLTPSLVVMKKFVVLFRCCRDAQKQPSVNWRARCWKDRNR